MKIPFHNNIIMLGCGAVAQCLQPLLIQHLAMDFSKIIIIDPALRPEHLPLIQLGARYIQQAITQNNYQQVLSTYAHCGDIIIDLAVDIGSIDLMDWCHKNNIMYINTSVELWPEILAQAATPLQKTLYERHKILLQKAPLWNGSTMIVEHGANPGLVSHWTKQALLEIAQNVIIASKKTKRRIALENALSNKDFPELARLTGTRIIHISERDTQITNAPKKVNEFVNTWSIPGLHEEATAPAEIGWGTHERYHIKHASKLHINDKKSYIHLTTKGMNTWAYSWIPQGPIIGMIIRHGEVLSISDHLTVYKEATPIYRPTVHYVYLPSDSTCSSLHELAMHKDVLQKKIRILRDEITHGSDELGVLLLGHDFNGWWTGSSLTIDEARRLVKNQNATTLQVAASVLGALFWMIQNPHKGFCFPDDLPHEDILAVANSYLGTIISTPTPWQPPWNLLHHIKDPWRFEHFLVTY
ncbi:MAG: saccharopine dehydrogenase C-terminal domain-containing protein [Candidatus Babeliaceae bacterium]|jgi:homospermidine synthase